MAKGDSVISGMRSTEESPPNGGEPPSEWPSFSQAEARVPEHQRKLHRWAQTESQRRFADLFNLVCDRATLMHAWQRVAGNKGSATAGVDAVTRFAVIRDDGLVLFLENLRASLRDGSFTPMPSPATASAASRRPATTMRSSSPRSANWSADTHCDHAGRLRHRPDPAMTRRPGRGTQQQTAQPPIHAAKSPGTSLRARLGPRHSRHGKSTKPHQRSYGLFPSGPLTHGSEGSLRVVTGEDASVLARMGRPSNL